MCFICRQFHSGGSGTAEAPPKMTTKVLSITQWKVLNQLKEYYNKYSNDKNFQQLFSKELASILQKIHPGVYGNNVIRNFETTVTKEDVINKEQLQPNLEEKDQKVPKEIVKQPRAPQTKDQGYTVTNVLTGFGLKMGKTPPVVAKPKWKQASPVTKCSVTSRTHHVISMITTAETDSSKLKRIEDLTSHLKHFPEAKHQAFKVVDKTAIKKGVCNFCMF